MYIKNTQPSVDVDHVVILVHGIRDLAAWHQVVDRVIGSSTTRVVAARYGYFSAFRFIAPWDAGKRPEELVYRDLLTARRNFPRARISVIAHSFGTHLVTRVLLKYPDIRLWRIIFCGSVVKQDFQWDRVVEQVGDPVDTDKARYIINDCGNRDIWPVLGASAGWRYGNAGTDGFGGPNVTNRFHDGGHGLFFNEAFIREYWKPFVCDGVIAKGPATNDGVPFWLRMLTQLPLQWLLQVVLPILLIAGIAMLIAFWPPSTQTDLTTFDSFQNFAESLLAVIPESGKEANIAAKENDFQDFLKRELPKNRFERWQAKIKSVEPMKYYIWYGDEPPKFQVIASFQPDTRFDESANIGDEITFSGRFTVSDDRSLGGTVYAFLEACILEERRTPSELEKE